MHHGCMYMYLRFMLTIAFALQRGNADMFARADARRRRNKSNNAFSLRLDSGWDSSNSSSSDSD